MAVASDWIVEGIDVVAGSIALHDLWVTPLMQKYSALIGEDRRAHD
jgi:hypothetical protein